MVSDGGMSKALKDEIECPCLDASDIENSPLRGWPRPPAPPPPSSPAHCAVLPAPRLAADEP